jgi:hypothetical protein
MKTTQNLLLFQNEFEKIVLREKLKKEKTQMTKIYIYFVFEIKWSLYIYLRYR